MKLFGWNFSLARNSADTPMSQEEIFRRIGGGDYESYAGVSVSPETAMRYSTVYACVRVLAESIAQLPLHLYTRQADGGRQRMAGHPLEIILNEQPNEWQSSFEFREMMAGHLLLRGRALAYISRAGDGKILELIPLHPVRTQIKQMPDTTLRFKVTKADNTEIWLEQKNVMYLRGLSFDGVNALSPVGCMRESIGLAQATQRHGSSLFKNGASVRGILKHPQKLSPEAKKNIGDSFDRLHGGENAFRTPVFEEGLDYQQISMSNEDAQFLDTRKFERSDICGMFRVPPHMVGDLERATFSNIEHQGISFVVHSLMPWLIRWEQAILRDVIAPDQRRHMFAKFQVAGLLRGDIKARYDAYRIAITTGWMNRNEVRGLEDMNPAEGLDEYLSPLNMAEVGKEDDTDDKAPGPKAGDDAGEGNDDRSKQKGQGRQRRKR